MMLSMLRSLLFPPTNYSKSSLKKLASYGEQQKFSQEMTNSRCLRKAFWGANQIRHIYQIATNCLESRQRRLYHNVYLSLTFPIRVVDK